VAVGSGLGVGGATDPTPWPVPGAKAAGLTTKAGSSRLGQTRTDTQAIRRAATGACPGVMKFDELVVSTRQPPTTPRVVILSGAGGGG